MVASKEVLALSDGKVIATIAGKNYTLIEAKSGEATLSLNKEEVRSLGTRMVGHKVTSSEGTGTLNVHYVSSMWAEIAEQYKDGGAIPDISITATMESKTGSIGKQTVRLYGVLPDEVSLFSLEADDGTIEDEFDFTFEDFKLIDKFAALKR
jgi:hypothetical protein